MNVVDYENNKLLKSRRGIFQQFDDASQIFKGLIKELHSREPEVEPGLLASWSAIPSPRLSRLEKFPSPSREHNTDRARPLSIFLLV